MSYYHAVVWVDHEQAHVIQFNRDDAITDVVHAKAGQRHIHHRKGSIGAGKAGEDPEFFRAVSGALAGVGEILLTGPAAAKLHLLRWWQAHDKAIADKVVGIESSDHPSDGQLLKHARTYFHGADQLRPQG